MKAVKRIAYGIVSIGLTLILIGGMWVHLIFPGSRDVTNEWFFIMLFAGWFWIQTALTEMDKERNIYHILLERVLLAIPGFWYIYYLVSMLMKYGMVPEWTFSEPVHVMSYVFWFLMLVNYIAVPIVLLIITIVRIYKKHVRTGE